MKANLFRNRDTAWDWFALIIKVHIIKLLEHQIDLSQIIWSITFKFPIKIYVCIKSAFRKFHSRKDAYYKFFQICVYRFTDTYKTTFKSKKVKWNFHIYFWLRIFKYVLLCLIHFLPLYVYHTERCICSSNRVKKFMIPWKISRSDISSWSSYYFLR